MLSIFKQERHESSKTTSRSLRKCAKEATTSNGKVLFIQVGSELLYNIHKWTTGLGPIGDSCGNGLLFHSCQAVKFKDNQPNVIGLSAQEAWVREEKDENSEKKLIQKPLKPKYGK